MLIATPDCNIQFANDEAREWLKNFFGRPPRAGRLPRKVCRWLAEEPTASTTKPLVAQRRDATLFVQRQRPHPSHSIVLLVELHNLDGTASSRLKGPLTRREREVLKWVTAGKSDRHVAEILGITRATVSKHLERIYPKLGVEK